MRRAVVTVVGSRRRVNLAVSTESPVRDLARALAERCGERSESGGADQTQEGWVLATASAGRLPPDNSLEECGVGDGAVIYVRRAASGDAARLSHGRAAPVRSAEIPERLGGSQRMARAIAAMLPQAAHSGSAELPRLPSLEVLTAPRPSPPLARARRAWSEGSYRRRLDAHIAAPRLRRCATVAVMSPKGGVGKTTTAVLVGTLLAMLRRDRVVAVDTNPDHGSLGRSLTPGHERYVDDLLHLLDGATVSATALDAAMGRGPHGLMVLPAPTEPERMARLDEAAYVRVIRRLQDLVGTVILDCGTGLQEPAARAALRCADQVLLVSDAEPATASIVAESSHRLEDINRALFLVVNKMPPRGARINVSGLLRAVPSARGVVLVPDEADAASRLAAGDFDWASAPRGWSIALRELLAVMVASWRERGLTLEEAGATSA